MLHETQFASFNQQTLVIIINNISAGPLKFGPILELNPESAVGNSIFYTELGCILKMGTFKLIKKVELQISKI